MEPTTFEVLGPIRRIETIATGRGVRARRELRRKYGGEKWRKMKGMATVRDELGQIYEAEIHWCEAHGVGKVDWKIKEPRRG